MQKLSKKASTRTVSSALRFMFIRLSSRPPLASIRAEVEAEWGALRSAAEAYAAARMERIVATAEATYRSALVNEAVQSLSRELSGLVGYDHEDERYRQIFLMPPSAIARLPEKEKEATILGMLDDLKNKAAFAPLAAQAALLEQALVDHQAALRSRAALYGKELSAKATLARLRERARLFYNKLFFRLSLLFSSKALVESFFYKLPKPAKPAEAEETEEEEEDEIEEDEAEEEEGD